jgi:hypothetical protein
MTVFNTLNTMGEELLCHIDADSVHSLALAPVGTHPEAGPDDKDGIEE